MASEALAAGRPGISASFRFHRPRGPLCGRGHCFSCEVDTPAGPVLACQSPPASRPGRHRDPLRPLGRVAEHWPPWFYERRFLRTEPVRRFSLEALRRLSAAGSLPAPSAARPLRLYDVVEAETVQVGKPEPGDDALAVDLAAGDIALGVYPGKVLGALQEGRLVEIRFERLVLATGSYERLPPIAGNDLPGVIGLHAAERYAPSLRSGTRVAVWGPSAARRAVEELARRHGLALVWSGERAPRSLSGRGRVERVHAEETVPCDVFVSAVGQPAVELALQAGARGVLTDGELPILTCADLPPWLELRGGAASRSSGVPDVPAHDDAFACLCEDVRVGDLRACVRSGFSHPELVKRRTGALTGPCQGKLCSAAVLAVLREEGIDPSPTTSRPLARPVTLGDLAAHA